MRYIPSFEQIKALVQISPEKGELRVTASYENFITIIRQMLMAVYVDDDWYFEHYPDVAEAVAQGFYESARHHFLESGYFEGRFPCEPLVDEVWYLSEYPDVAESIRRGHVSSALRHFIEDGYREGRRPFGY